MPSSLRSGPKRRQKIGISFSARDQVAKFSQFDSPTVIYLAGQEPSSLASPEMSSAPEPVQTTFSLGDLGDSDDSADNYDEEERYGEKDFADDGDEVELGDEYGMEDDGHEDEQEEQKEEPEDGEQPNDQEDDDDEEGPRVSDREQRAAASARRRRGEYQREKQREVLHQLQEEAAPAAASRVAPVKRSAGTVVAEVVVGSLQITATVAEFGLSMGELPLALHGVPGLRTDPMYAETAVTNNPALYRGAVAVVRRGGGVSFAKKALRVQLAGAVCCIIVNDGETVMERVAAKSGDLDARKVDIPVLCVPLCAGEVLMAMMPAVVSVRVWLASSNKQKRETNRALASVGRSDLLHAGKVPKLSSMTGLRTERAARKQLILDLHAAEVAKQAAEASSARLEERFAGAARAAARERDKQAVLVAAVAAAEEAAVVAEEARSRAEVKAKVLEEVNDELMQRLAHYAREESETFKLRMAENRRSKRTADYSTGDGALMESGARMPKLKLKPKLRESQRAGDSYRVRESVSVVAAARQSPAKTKPRVADALQLLHEAVVAQVYNGALSDEPAAQVYEDPVDQLYDDCDLTPEKRRELCGDGDRLMLRQAAATLGVADVEDEAPRRPTSLAAAQMSRNSQAAAQKKQRQRQRQQRPLQSTTNRHNATGFVRQPAHQRSPECGPAPAPPTAVPKARPTRQGDYVHHAIHPSLHYDRHGVVSAADCPAVGVIGSQSAAETYAEFAGADPEEDWADHARRVASVLRRGGASGASTAAGGRSGKTAGVRRRVATRSMSPPAGSGSGWNGQVGLGAF